MRFSLRCRRDFWLAVDVPSQFGGLGLAAVVYLRTDHHQTKSPVDYRIHHTVQSQSWLFTDDNGVYLVKVFWWCWVAGYDGLMLVMEGL